MKASRSLQLLLVVPTLLIMVSALLLIGYSLYSLNSQYTIASDAQVEDLGVIEEAARFGVEIGRIQTRVAAALHGARSGTLSELQLYRMHSAIVNDLERLGERVHWLAAAGLVIRANHDSAVGLREAFDSYRRFVIMSTDVIAVDPAVAAGYISEAVVHYRDFSIYANRITRLLAERSAEHNREQQAAFNETLGRVLLIGLPALAGIMLLVILVARHASRGLVDIADGLGQLASNPQSNLPLPRVEAMAEDASGEFSSIANTLLGFRDALERQRQAEERAYQLTFYDPLTDLPNRRLLGERVGHAFTACLRQDQHAAILWVDLDDFKTLNGLRGHGCGDLLLREVAHRLREAVDENDTVARLGGDEFGILVESLGSEPSQAARGIEGLVARIYAIFDRPMTIEGEATHTTASVGGVLFNGREDSVDDILRYAETAMYRAKEEGRNTFRFYNPQMQEQLEARLRLERELYQAVEDDQLQLFYQLQVNQRDEPVGVEALLRWIHPERGLIPPLEFIPLAEETGSILPMGLWVLETACDQLRAWSGDPVAGGLTVAVNVSARQFMQPDFVEQVRRALDERGVRPERLKLELTESTVLEDLDTAVTTMRALRAIGVHFSLDDFGTGYSSLQYLKRLPLDQLKIDQSFVSDITVDSDDATIVETIIAMGHAMGLQVIAEGVETREQQDFLSRHGCQLYQGYLFSRPLPRDELARRLNQ